MPNEAQKTPKIAPRGSLTMRINPKPARERVLYPEHPRRYFPIVDEKLFDGLQLSVFLPHILNNNSSTGRLFPTRTYRSEERRVGKEYRTRRTPYRKNKKKAIQRP